MSVVHMFFCCMHLYIYIYVCDTRGVNVYVEVGCIVKDNLLASCSGLWPLVQVHV
jgi:hypothetical protein